MLVLESEVVETIFFKIFMIWHIYIYNWERNDTFFLFNFNWLRVEH